MNGKKPLNNLTKEETEAKNEAKSQEDVIITKANKHDKVGAVVLMDVIWYVVEADRQQL